MENLLKEYSVKELRLLLTHINKKTKISGIRLMKKNEIINLIKSHYSPKTVISNGEIRFTPLKMDIGDISLKEKKKKEKKEKAKPVKKLKEKVKEKVVEEVVKDVVKEVKKRGRPPKKQEVVEIKKEVKKVVEKKKPAPNKKAKEHIKKIEKEVI